MIKQKGFSLIETVLYIGILSIILPALTLFLLNLSLQFRVMDPRVRMEQKASIIHEQIQNELVSAYAINTTASTLGIDDSILVLVDKDGQTVTIDTADDLVSFPGNDVVVRRLRYQRGATPAIWLTDADFEIDEWIVYEVRDSFGTLTGLRFLLGMRLLNNDDVYRNTEFGSGSTIELQPHTGEI